MYANLVCFFVFLFFSVLIHRIEECAGQNKNLDVKLKKKEEILLKNERELLEMENR